MRRKFLLRWVIFLAALWMALLGAIYLTNLKYRDQVISVLKSYLDQYIQTEIHIRKDNIRLSVLKKFPYASIDLYDILIKSARGPNYSQFAFQGKDTLLSAQRISLVFNLMSILTKKYELNRIEIDNAFLNVLVDKNGVGNYSILKPVSNEPEKGSFSIDLRKIQLRDVHSRYIDIGSNIDFTGFLQNATLSGVLSEDNFSLKLQMKAQQCNVNVQSKNYLQKQSLTLITEIEKKEQIYTLNHCNINLSGLKLEANGKWEKEKKYYSLLIESKANSLRDIEYPMFASYMAKINYLPENGTLNLEASFSGITGSGNPYVKAKFEILNGAFKNKVKNIDIENFFIHGYFTNGVNRNKSTSILEIDTLSLVSGKSSVYIKGKIENFLSPVFSMHLKGTIELERLNAIDPIKQRFELSGMVNTAISMNGILPSSMTDRSFVDNLSINGELNFKNVFIKTLVNPLPPSIVSGKIAFQNFRTIRLENITIGTGKSLFIVDGTVTDIPIFNSDTAMVPIYRCNITSPEMHVEDFLLKGSEAKSQVQTTKAAFPDSLIAFANFSADKFFFGKFEASAVNGNIQYQPKKLHISGLSMKSQEGAISSDINISQDGSLFIVSSDANIQNADIKNLFYSFNNFGQSVIGSDNMNGRLFGIVHVTAVWDQYLHPVFDRLNLQSEIEIDKGEIINYGPLMGLSKFIKVDELKHIYFDRLQTSINIQQETVYISQTDIRSSAISLKGSGEHHFDNSYLYRLQVQLSDVLWNKAKKKKPENTEFGYEIDDGLGKTTLPLKIKGKDTEFEVSYDLHTAGDLFFDKFRKEKKVMHNLFSPNDTSEKKLNNVRENSPLRIEWSDDSVGTIKQKQNKIPDKKEDFSIEWKDE